MTIALRLLLMGLLGALATLVAHRGWSAYHDGLRPMIKDIAEGKIDRRTASKTTWDISIGFIVSYALPFSLITGIMGNLILFLGADLLGVAVPMSSLALAAGFVWGVGSSAVVSAGPWVFNHLPRPIGSDLLAIGAPLPYLLPLMPVVAINSQFGQPRGWQATVGVLAIFGIAIWPLHPVAAATISFLAGLALLLWWATRERPAEIPEFPPDFDQGAATLRRGLPPLIAIGALLGLMGSLFWIAGDPGVTMLLGLHHPVEAGLLSILSWIGFLPLTVLTSLASGAYTSAGNPDGLLGVSYLVPFAPIAALLGAAIMAGEVRWLKRIERALAHRPGLHSAGVAVRDGMHTVLDVSFLLGGAYSANLIWPGVGVVIVGLAWVVNEATGVRVMRLGIGPMGAIATGVLLNLLLVLKLVPGGA
ncbi:MAG TPA: YhfT family protein [Candidatus Limnocylindrales bacterium]|nr:YhfT family protein [Candidatus Limnocylindrales bacterium]